jgi:hypothetical protein
MLSSWKVALTSRRLRMKFCLSWSVRATRNTSHDSCPRFYAHVVSFQKSSLQICGVSRRIWCLLSAPVSRPSWNRKYEDTRGDKHSCCATLYVHTATPLGMLSGNVPCSQAQRTHSRTAIGWRSMELVLKLFDTPLYKPKSWNAFKLLFSHHQVIYEIFFYFKASGHLRQQTSAWCTTLHLPLFSFKMLPVSFG